MQIILIIVTLLLIAYLMALYDHKKYIRKLRARIKDEYGKKPTEKIYDYKILNYHWSEYSTLIVDDEKIDDITWNDLEMDKVFSRINMCNSYVGEQVLYSTLHTSPKDKQIAEILERKISFFVSNQNEREEIQILLDGLSKKQGCYYLPKFIVQLNAFRIPGIWKYRLMQILLALSIIPAIGLKNPDFLFITLSIFLVNIIIYTVGKHKYEVDLGMLNSIVKLVNVGNSISDNKRFAYEKEFHDLNKEAMLFKRLSRMVGVLQRKKEATFSGDIFGLLQDYIIGATLWDFIKYDQIICELENNQKEYMEIYKKVGEIDMSISIASFRESLPLFCTPTFTAEHVFKMEQIYHPLIDEPVYNSVILDKSCIITGSNASGKSTYIKAIAINTILAQSIHTCTAKQIVLPYARLITSMAIRDDLMTGESYYIKEIKYLNRIVQNLSEDRLVICVIDEILRGTNTEERIAASVSILEFLKGKNCIAIVASHDIELTQLLDKKYDNYHFREHMQESDIIFDYKLYKGATVSKNAIKLLEFVGFPDEIITKARNLVKC